MTQTPGRSDPAADGSNVMPFCDVNAETTPRRIADQLMSARLGRGVELEDIVGTLHIRLEYLKALEDARFDDLPGPTYVVGFLRTYGKHLGLDGEELVRMYKDKSGGVLTRQNLYFPVPASEARRPTGRMIAVALLVAVIALAVWYVVGERHLVDLEQIPPVPDFLAETSSEDSVALAAAGDDVTTGADVETMFAEGESAQTGVDGPAYDGSDENVATAGAEVGDVAIARDDLANTASDNAEAIVSAGIEPVQSDEVTETDATQDVAAVIEEIPLPPEPEPEVVAAADESAGLGEVAATAADEDYVPRVYGRTNADSRVELRAVETSWIQIEAPGNQVLLTRVLAPGDIYRVPNSGDIMLKTGNAGGLEVRVDGELIEPLGDQGEVIKDVLLEPDSLLDR